MCQLFRGGGLKGLVEDPGGGAGTMPHFGPVKISHKTGGGRAYFSITPVPLIRYYGYSLKARDYGENSSDHHWLIQGGCYRRPHSV